MAAKQGSHAVSQRPLAEVNSYDDRYAGDYKYTCAITHAATGGICCWCMVRPSEEIHHVHYKDSLGAIAGREVPGLDVFPICFACHIPVCHHRNHWVHVAECPELNNHNTPEFIAQIIDRFNLACLLKP